ncbi:MAG: lamin tail domain-containing protein [Candidatus Promineifilaceae bacterium]
MERRFLWLLAAVCLPTSLLLVFQAESGWAERPQSDNSVIISEVAWGGTAANSADEWIELHNPTADPINLSGWTLTNGGSIQITLTGVISAGGFYLLERTDDNTVSDIPADQFYTGALTNGGQSLELRDAASLLVDTANGDGGSWPAGTGSPDYLSMERDSPTAEDTDDNWHSNNTLERNGLDADGSPINGTPRQPNSGWNGPAPTIDLVLHKTGPAQATAGSNIQYTLTFTNTGSQTATGVVLTDTLPSSLTYITDNSGFPFNQPTPGTLVWQVGSVPTATLQSFQLTAVIGSSVIGLVTNQATISTPLTETNTLNNTAQATTNVTGSGTPLVLIDAVLYDGYETADADEAVRLINLGDGSANISGWQLTDGSSTATFPDGTVLEAGQTIWLSWQAAAFTRQFGFSPDFEVTETDAAVPNLTGTWPGFSNSGDEVLLLNGSSRVDVLVYEGGNTAENGWVGQSVQPYTVTGVFGAEGQILYRMRQQATGLPVTDTDTAADWAQSLPDPVNGRKVQYPGWNLEQFFFPAQSTETAELIVAIAPDNAYEAITAEINAAQTSIQIESLTFENIGIVNALISAANRGVSVTALLEGGPTGGITDQERYICQELETGGGQCWFMISDDSQAIFDRYRYLHAKFMLIDSQRAVISSENLSPNSLPYDDKSDGTWGRRGVALITDATSVVGRLADIWAADFDPAHHVDLFRWSAVHPTYGAPPPDYEPITETGGISYTVRYPSPAVYQGTFSFEVSQAPENSLRTLDGLLALVNQAGEGDTILVQQLNERPYWGASSSSPTADPNPRLEAYLDAARRGAKVRLLLDDFFDTPGATSNLATCAYVNGIALDEGLNLQCTRGNPTGLGIHNKMVLVSLNGVGYVHVGSLNGTEQSNKGNREVALQVHSNQAYNLLADMFERDWPHQLHLPLLFNDYDGPVNYVLISEVLYDPPGIDDAEFIELVNPTALPINISSYRLGDAVNPTDFEDVRIFPAGTVIPSGETIVVATTATAFYAEYGFNPDFEILDSDPAVPDLIDDPLWGDPNATLQLGNTGDELILRNPAGQIVDAIAYGLGSLPGVIPCPLVMPNYSLERYPYWLDTNNCTADFREWPFPNPGSLPD